MSAHEESTTEAVDTVMVVIEGPGDTTGRPRPPYVPRRWPEGEPQALPTSEPGQADHSSPAV